MFFLLSVCALCLCVGAQYADPYVVPEAQIEVFSPRGLRISIPDHPGVRLFAVHAVVNRELNGLEAGDISKDILKRTGDRWVFEDKKLKLNYGDVVNYWLFVIKGHLGYRLDDQTYTVTHYYAAPNGWNNGKGPSRKTTTASPHIVQGEYVPITPLPPISCSCPEPAPTPAPSCTPTAAPPPSASSPGSADDLAIWRELLVNLSTENADLRRQISTLYDNNQLLVDKLKRLGDENLTKLRLEGQVLPDDSPIDLIKTILVENLKILDTKIVKSAVRNDDGSITFDMWTVNDKLLVLRTAKQKLGGAKFMIKDIDAISFTNNDGEVLIDMRNPEVSSS